MTPSDANLHIMPLDGVWAVQREGAGGIVSVHPNKADAVAEGVALAKREGVDLVIHDSDGQVVGRNFFRKAP
jgi:hypothetical protein